MRTTAFEAAATTGGSASEEAAPAGEASTAGTSEFVGQVGKRCILFLLEQFVLSAFVSTIGAKGSRAIKKAVKKGDNITPGEGGSPPVPFFSPNLPRP